MFFKRKKELKKLREDYDEIVSLLSRMNKQMTVIEKQNEELLERTSKEPQQPEPKRPDVTARQIINEWYHFEEERVKNDGRIE